jgi:hypothetical protein
MMAHQGQEVNSHSCKAKNPFKYFRKLIKFRGRDYGKSKLEIDLNVNQIEFPDMTSLKSIFLPLPESDDNKTAFGEVVYLRHPLDFSNKTS